MVVACAGRTIAIREAERDMTLHALLAVQMDARVPLSCETVRRDALHQLRIPACGLLVTKVREASFLLRFERPEQRNAALRGGPLMAGHTKLHVMPWSRQYRASGSKLKYRVRVCTEGVPAHAAQVETVVQLFPSSSFIGKIDTEVETEDEKACLCIWVWAVDPDAIAKEGVLRMEEPVEFSEEELSELRNEAARMLDYKVLLHLDRVVDYTSSQSSPSWKSYASVSSGIPDETVEDEWPVKRKFSWQLGVKDGQHVPWRISVHGRLGERRRDRSPSDDGNGGRRQVPPASWHGITRFRGRGDGAGSSRQGGQGAHHAGGGLAPASRS
ncbi:hypothetical protein PVAP13_4NG286300 [Panicum virgatum]|uniref:Uncharacterized protein n=1 Tax=Panicum virgatum TaxID=38727 RepID=A0A8T0TJF5_PANVG|nr:hypothetical protein PVAP13_4NG286300 [Panicum virgatum]